MTMSCIPSTFSILPGGICIRPTNDGRTPFSSFSGTLAGLDCILSRTLDNRIVCLASKRCPLSRKGVVSGRVAVRSLNSTTGALVCSTGSPLETVLALSTGNSVLHGIAVSNIAPRNILAYARNNIMLNRHALVRSYVIAKRDNNFTLDLGRCAIITSEYRIIDGC